MTYSIGVVGPSYWAYMAICMKEGLEEIIEKGKIEGNEIQKGIYLEAQTFLTSVKEAKKEIPGMRRNIMADIENYLTFVNVAEASSNYELKTDKDFEKYLSELFSFTNRLQNPRELKPKEIKTAISVKDFYRILHKRGEDEDQLRRTGPFDSNMPPHYPVLWDWRKYSF